MTTVVLALVLGYLSYGLLAFLGRMSLVAANLLYYVFEDVSHEVRTRLALRRQRMEKHA